MDSLAIIELQRWGFPGVTKCGHRSIEFLTTQADQSKLDILIDYVLKKYHHAKFKLLCVKMAEIQQSLAYKKLLFRFSLLFYPLFSQKLCGSVSYKAVSYMRDCTVQIMISIATIGRSYFWLM